MAFTRCELCQSAFSRRKKTGKNPTDRGKQGAKRSILTEAAGVPIGIVIGSANRHDSRLLIDTIRSIPVQRPQPSRKKPQGMCLDKAYDADWIRHWLQRRRFTPHVRSRGEEKIALQTRKGFKARRWVVERTHSWFNRKRGVLIRWEKKPRNYEAMLHIAAGLICFKRSKK